MGAERHPSGPVHARAPGRGRAAAWALALAVAAALGPPLEAQTNLETNAGVYFNFSTPGAANLALGGAFLALAFDASAAYTNPAGLTLVSEPESLVEGRHWRFTHVFTDRGRIAGEEPSHQGIDTTPGLVDGEARDGVTGPSFLSYVHPVGRWSFAVYRHELVDFRASFDTHGAFLERVRGRNPLGIPGELDGRLAALRNRMEVGIDAYGVAAARRLGGGVSLGLALSYFDFSIDSLAERYRPDLDEPPDFSRNPLLNEQIQRGTDTDWGITAGLHWQSRQRRWSLGAVYRQGPDFGFRARNRPDVLPPEFRFEPSNQAAVFHVPDVYGLGVAFRPTQTLRLALDYDRVRYSQLTDGFVDVFDLAHLPSQIDPELDRFRVDDVGEIHLGAEYALLRGWPVVFLRAGAWYEPDHSLRFEGQNVGFRAVFRPRGDLWHATAGVGLALRRLQVDLAVDRSDRIQVISLSSGLRF